MTEMPDPTPPGDETAPDSSPPQPAPTAGWEPPPPEPTSSWAPPPPPEWTPPPPPADWTSGWRDPGGPAPRRQPGPEAGPYGHCQTPPAGWGGTGGTGPG